MMTWELYGCRYLYDENDEDKICEGISCELFLGGYNHFDDAFKAFSETMNNSDWPRLWIKVFKDETDAGEIVVAYSGIWGDNIFNEDGI